MVNNHKNMKLIINKTTQLIDFAFNNDNTPFEKSENLIIINEKPFKVDNSDNFEEIVVPGENVPSYFVPNLYWYEDGIKESPLCITLWENVRKERNKRLTECDWTQMPDVTLSNKAEWDTYRQALRDITTQTNPFIIQWPNDPNWIDPNI
jgi:hypothetical protein